MGGGTFSQSTEETDIDNRVNEQSNYGLIKISSKSLMHNSSFNFIEIVTLILVRLAAL